ncbi:uncharacterized protein CPUR_06857 [Claviceps purpurea 20.1]|uniref:Tc1-like transposase DDE domain-containing protein n=1 Tax=Claviceps purpurea (strain 20.1) TaxID=1111077 RepID=M1WAB5_CLAP2|nr:uncharacterized protein CPUR_06857 [Claviceps purpurea 20.1]
MSMMSLLAPRVLTPIVDPHSPEFNPIEHVWKQLKHMRNMWP